jgi:predicted secreted hydrolase
LVRRRAFLGAAIAGLALPGTGRAAVTYPEVTAGVALQFPRDHGAHLAFRNEWWYLTGWLATAGGESLGFQVTFFRTRPPVGVDNPSSFAPTQILLAHAALADPKHGRLRHDQRAARPALDLAGAREGTTETWIDDWKLALRDGRYATTIHARDFSLELSCTPAAPPLLQGEGGYSRKGPLISQASYYYSRPQLKVSGSVGRGSRKDAVTGIAWLDHEWSSTLMSPDASGWDWVGLNLEGGGALMAFRMRDRKGGVQYAGGSLQKDGATHILKAGDIAFTKKRTWRSPRTAVEYPVAMDVTAGGETWTLEPLLDDQELDARSSTGTIYWEGAVRSLRNGREAGRGYLELTGYWKPLKL